MDGYSINSYNLHFKVKLILFNEFNDLNFYYFLIIIMLKVKLISKKHMNLAFKLHIFQKTTELNVKKTLNLFCYKQKKLNKTG